MQLTPSPVKQLALQHGLKVMQPLTLRDAEIQQQLTLLQAEVMVVAAYGLILPLLVLQIPRYGCLNIHASLLPRWRGAAPIQRAILAGDLETGVTIMQMDEGLDTGAMLLKKVCLISELETTLTLHDKLAKLGTEAIVEALVKLEADSLTAVKQDAAQATYAAKINKPEARLDWSQSATQLDRAIRAYNPAPGAYSILNETTIKIWQTGVSKEEHGAPGTILAVNKDSILVACGQGALKLKILQRPNGKPLNASQFLQGFAIKVGDKFATA